jgi:cysteine synthase B
MKAFGAELILTPERAAWNTHATWPSRCSARARAGARPVRQCRQPAHPLRDHRPRDLGRHRGRITHFVSAMGTTGTITGVSRYLKEQNPAVRIVGAQPAEGSRIPGIRKWPEAYLPRIYDARSTSWC